MPLEVLLTCNTVDYGIILKPLLKFIIVKPVRWYHCVSVCQAPTCSVPQTFPLSIREQCRSSGHRAPVPRWATCRCLVAVLAQCLWQEWCDVIFSTFPLFAEWFYMGRDVCIAWNRMTLVICPARSAKLLQDRTVCTVLCCHGIS